MLEDPYEYQRLKPRPIILPLITWLAAVGFIIILLVLIQGCATVPPSPRSEVCVLQLLGHTDGAMPVVAMTCVTPEQFAESQK